MPDLTISTTAKSEVVDITDRVQQLAESASLKDGVVHLSVAHTTAALSTADLDPGTDQDLLEAYRALVPELDYRHPHDPSHVGDHILSSLIGTSESVPVRDSKLVLGTWQRVVLYEFDGPRERTVVVTALAS